MTPAEPTPMLVLFYLLGGVFFFWKPLLIVIGATIAGLVVLRSRRK